MGKPQSASMNADSGQKTWLTPRRIVDALGPFDTDPCTPCFMPWRTATTMYNVFDDGTTAPWNGRGWLNPPCGREAVPFMRRMAGHPGGGIALVFARTETKLWQELVFPVAHAVLFVAGRIRFCHADGTEGESATAPSALIAYSARDVAALENSGIEGFIVYLKPKGENK